MSDELAEKLLPDGRKPHYVGLLLTALTGGAILVCRSIGWEVATDAAVIGFVSIIIWQLCEPFADAAQWIGNSLHMPSSVRGATLDAVASSLPEFFIGIFFVLLTVTGSDVAGAATVANGEGYGATVATCAGSAVYNMILIPAFVAIVISFKRKDRPTIDVEDNVIARDGVAFLVCEIVLLLAIHYELLTWWMGLVFIGMYLIYIFLLYNDWKKHELIVKTFKQLSGENLKAEDLQQNLREQGHSFGLSLVEKVVTELRREKPAAEEHGKTESYFCYNLFRMKLSQRTSWGIIAVVTLLVAGASFFLVESTRALAVQLHVPMFFLAVIVAAAASSVPDTFVSIAAAMRGDDSGAVSNVFGSNIFNICVCLGVPLLINSGMNDWQPVSLMQDGKPIEGLIGLQVLLGVFSTITLAMMWHNRQITRFKAIVFCGLYGVFITYAVVGSLGLMKV